MRRPEWLILPVAKTEDLEGMKKLLNHGQLHTVCESADCPNIGECFARKTCTFMILGKTCTRNCRFCAVEYGIPPKVNAGEPLMIAGAAAKLGLGYVVVTSVTRDDLPDGGADQFVATIKAIRDRQPAARVEVLIPDFQGAGEPLQQIIEAKPDVICHNIETVPRMYPQVRPQAHYARSLRVLQQVSAGGITAKSGVMLGLGERLPEVRQVMADIRKTGCRLLTLGQYLRPTPRHLEVAEYIHPDVFGMLAEQAKDLGFSGVKAGPLVRSSYHAAQQSGAVPE